MPPAIRPEIALEPLVVHAVEELWSDRKSRSRADHRIDWAFRTNGCLAVVNPFRDFIRGEDRKTVEATAKSTVLQFPTIKDAMLMRGV